MIKQTMKILPIIALAVSIIFHAPNQASAQVETYEEFDLHEDSKSKLLLANNFKYNAGSGAKKWHFSLNNEEFMWGDSAGNQKLNLTQKRFVYEQCMDGSTEAVCSVHALTNEEKRLYNEQTKEQEYLDAGGYALKVFTYAMGGANGDGKGCITCTFLGNFMLGLASFSAATFIYFQKAFMTLVPVMMAVWIGWRVSKLLISGGEDGRSFIYSITSKMALLFLVWAFISIGVPPQGPIHPDDDTPYAWNMVGPEYLKYAFSLSTEIRDATLQMQSNITTFSPGVSKDAFKCSDTVQFMEQFTSKKNLSAFSGAALDVACATERTHMVGFASGLAIIGSSTNQIGIFNLKSTGTGIVKLISGFFMLFVFGLSAVWFTFLVLDIVVRGMITAAFLPFIMGCLLFNPTRYIAVNTFKSLAGAIMTAVAIGIISTLAFFLLTNTVEVYNALAEQLDPVYDNINLNKIEETSSINAFREFIVRIQESDSDKEQIPMDLTTPWFYYLVLCGLAIFALGKKIISMLEGMIGTSGMSSMADNAMKMTRTSLGLGMGAAHVGANAGAFAGRSGVALTGAMVGAGKGPVGDFVKNTVNPFGANSSGMGMGGAMDTKSLMDAMQSGADVPPGE